MCVYRSDVSQSRNRFRVDAVVLFGAGKPILGGDSGPFLPAASLICKAENAMGFKKSEGTRASPSVMAAVTCRCPSCHDLA